MRLARVVVELGSLPWFLVGTPTDRFSCFLFWLERLLASSSSLHASSSFRALAIVFLFLLAFVWSFCRRVLLRACATLRCAVLCCASVVIYSYSFAVPNRESRSHRVRRRRGQQSERLKRETRERGRQRRWEASPCWGEGAVSRRTAWPERQANRKVGSSATVPWILVALVLCCGT